MSVNEVYIKNCRDSLVLNLKFGIDVEILFSVH